MRLEDLYLVTPPFQLDLANQSWKQTHSVKECRQPS